MRKYIPYLPYVFLGVLVLGVALFPDTAVFADLAFDQENLNKDKTGLPNQSPNETIFLVISAFLQFVGLVALVLIIYGGFLWLTAGGKKENVEKGRDVLFWATIGLLVILSSLGIVRYLDTYL